VTLNHYETVRVDRQPHLRHAARCARRIRPLDGKMAMQLIAQDAVVDHEFRSIMRNLITFMMEDPRTISAALDTLWVAKAIERIGDHAKNIAEYVIYVVEGKDIRHTKTLRFLTTCLSQSKKVRTWHLKNHCPDSRRRTGHHRAGDLLAA
jgi:phosphate transport system protein